MNLGPTAWRAWRLAVMIIVFIPPIMAEIERAIPVIVDGDGNVVQ